MPPDEVVLKDLVQKWLARADEDLAATYAAIAYAGL